jgi:hypothetical protein
MEEEICSNLTNIGSKLLIKQRAILARNDLAT